MAHREQLAPGLPSPAFGPDLALAHELADAADGISLAHYRDPDLTVATKPDRSLVSAADTAIEAELRRLLARRRPRDSVLGEELGADGDSAARRWIIDPIDATDNFVRRVPIWATLIALVASEQPVVGVVSAPALGRRWYAAAGHGAWLQESGTPPRRLAVSAVSTFADASLSYSDLTGWSATGRRAQALAVIDAAGRTRAYGDFWSYMLLAEGAVDVVIDPALALWDVAALIPIVRESNGEITGLDGEDPLRRGGILASNQALHGQLRRAMAAVRPSGAP